MMNTVMQKPSSVGEKRTCPECDVEVVGKEQTSTWQGKTTTKIRWANLDGTWHITKVGNDFKHQPTSEQQPIVNSTIQKELTNSVFANMLQMIEIKGEIYMALAVEIKRQVDTSSITKGVPDSEKGFIKHDICEKVVTPKLLDDMAMKLLAYRKNPSAEIDEVAYSSQVLNGGNGVSSKGSFHTSSAVKDGQRYDVKRQVATLPTPPFFSENIRWIAKCVKHGVICNEDDYKCKQCVEEYMDKQFATGGTIDRGLLL